MDESAFTFFKYQYTLRKILVFLLIGWTCFSCEKTRSEDEQPADFLTLTYARLGSESIMGGRTVAPEGDLVIGFSAVAEEVSEDDFLLSESGRGIALEVFRGADQKEVRLVTEEAWQEGGAYRLIVKEGIKGTAGQVFPGDTLNFHLGVEALRLELYDMAGKMLKPESLNQEISLSAEFRLVTSHSVPVEILKNNMLLTGPEAVGLDVEQTSDTSFALKSPAPWPYYRKYTLSFPEEIGAAADRPFTAVDYELFTTLDSSYKFPEISEEELLTKVQQQTFRYFWEGAEPRSGMARERLSSGSTVTTGGTGFGLMAMIVAVERGFITREEALERWEKIVSFLETADRFHGAWPHWLDGQTGRVQPFSEKDNGADLVETAFLVEGLLTVRQYLRPENPREAELAGRIGILWAEVEWDWFTRDGKKVLYWHWSPEYEWQMNLPVRGHDETQLVYVLAASSPDHGISREVYEEGYARGGNMKNGKEYYGYTLPLGPDGGGPLFFTHYSYLGLDPRNLKDQYADYWEQNKAHTLINRAYCIANPKNYVGYSADCWGLTASDEPDGYSAHSPAHDPGVITPTAAVSSLPYTPKESMKALRHFYYLLGDRLWGEYGFYDAFDIGREWVADSYLAIDQGPIICMIENYRTGLLWDLFMSAPEVRKGLEKLNISYE